MEIAIRGLLLVAMCSLFPAAAAGQYVDADARVVNAVRLEPGDQIVLDGRLDEPVWERAGLASGFLQQEPHEGRAASQETEVRVLYSDSHLYLGIVLYDTEPDAILAYQRRRNASLGTDDRFAWILDTFLDGRSAYYFEINPLGLMGDGLLRTGQGGGLNRSWDGIWDVRTSRGPYGWSAEIRIPFRTLNFDPQRSEWGINFMRTIRRHNEDALWAGHRRNQGIFRPQHAGRLVGLEGISQGVGLEAKPYAIAGLRHLPAEPGQTFQTPYDTGIDFTYNVTTNLRASLTINTDFAEVEVDQRRVNLTRFPLHYPERRDFFLEGSGVYQFVPASSITPFFSRRIGLVAGESIPILVGGRLAGQAGAYDIGFLQVRTARHGQYPAEDFTAARVVRNVLAESSVGVIYTRRATGATSDVVLPDRHTAGIDVQLNTSRFLGDQNLQFESFVVWHNPNSFDDASSSGHRTARGLRLAYPNPVISGHVSYREFGDAFDPAVGFTPRRSFRRLQPSVSFTPYLDASPVIRQLAFGVRYEYLMDLRYRPETVSWNFTLAGVRFETGDAAEFTVGYGYERLGFDFPIFTDVVIPPGEYSGWDWRVAAESARHRPVSAGAEFRRGHFWSGHRNQIYTGMTFRPRPGYNLSVEWAHTAVSLREGAFGTHLVNIRNDLDVTPWISIHGNVQYDDVSRVVGFFGRFRWIMRPGSDLFFVYQHNWRNIEGGMVNLGSGGTLKGTYTHRF